MAKLIQLALSQGNTRKRMKSQLIIRLILSSAKYRPEVFVGNWPSRKSPYVDGAEAELKVSDYADMIAIDVAYYIFVVTDLVQLTFTGWYITFKTLHYH